MKTMRSSIAILTLATAFIAHVEASPGPDLFRGPRLEWVPSAVSLVRNAEPDNKETLIGEVLAQMAERQPLLMPSLVGALSKALPDRASVIASEAATLVPDYAADIAALVAVPFAEHEVKRGGQSMSSPKAAALRAESTDIIIAAVTEESPTSAEAVESVVAEAVDGYRSYTTLRGKGSSGKQPGTGKGKGVDLGHGTNKPHPGKGEPAHKGEGSKGKGRGTIHGRGTLNNYDCAR